MNQSKITLPEYSANKFVQRAEASAVVARIHDLIDGKPVLKRTMAFSGERGTGKTWFLKHLQEEAGKIRTVRVYFLDLGKYASLDPVVAVANILKDFRERVIKQKNGFGATLADMSRQLAQELRFILRDQVLLLLVDQAYESDWSLLGALEDYLLGPLAVEPRVMIVMTGRGWAYPWKTPELRLKAEFGKLGPFPKVAQTAEQLEKQVSRNIAVQAQRIHDQSGGNPLANYLLGVGESIDFVLNYIIEILPPETRKRAREYLEALCVLQAFDEERIPTMLAAYYGSPAYLQWSYAEARKVRDLLVRDTAFARWNEDAGGFVMDSQVRWLAQNYLKTEQHKKWRDLQCAAYRLYKGWIEEYSRAREHWQAQASYHAQQLQDQGHDLEECLDVETSPVAQYATIQMTA